MITATRTFRSMVLGAAVPVMHGCMTSPKAEAARQEQMLEVGAEVNDLRVTAAALSATVDSLRTVIARHDTTLARVANVTGVVVAK